MYPIGVIIRLSLFSKEILTLDDLQKFDFEYSILFLIQYNRILGLSI